MNGVHWLARSATAPAYRDSFYVMAATVIPVLMLALGLQSTFVLEMAVKVRVWHHRQEREVLFGEKSVHGWRATAKWMGRLWVARRVDELVMNAAMGIVVLWGTFGELCAITAVWKGAVTPREAWWTHSSLILLTLLVGLWTFVRYIVKSTDATLKDAAEWRASKQQTEGALTGAATVEAKDSAEGRRVPDPPS